MKFTNSTATQGLLAFEIFVVIFVLKFWRKYLQNFNIEPQVVIAGFGKETYMDKSGVTCWTSEEEPNPFSPCKPSFKHNGKKYKVTLPDSVPIRVARFFYTIYKNRGKFTKLLLNYQMAVKYSKWP
jgi:hypothetical protein